ncbi:MAG: hypothetical protein JXB88_18640 [Spirochaetales bacterium]|nr:hypothetical protein [Spirochaetales bacterium]
MAGRNYRIEPVCISITFFKPVKRIIDKKTYTDIILADCKNLIIVVDFLQLALEYFYFIILKGIKNTPLLYRLVLAVDMVFLLEPHLFKKIKKDVTFFINLWFFVKNTDILFLNRLYFINTGQSKNIGCR